VPVPSVSLCDLVCDLSKDITVEQINSVFQDVSTGKLKGILEYCAEPLVSTDFRGNQSSSIFDSLQTMVIGDNMAKIIAWYDNEWGYSCRMADLALMLFNKGL
jgi:glyceraldehyde 3-phosphate dehydrogenase